MNKTIGKSLLGVLLMLCVCVNAQEQYDDGSNFDVVVSKDVIKGTALAKTTLLGDIASSSSQGVMLASSNSFFRVGNGKSSPRKVSGKKIVSFCIVDNNIYFTDKSNLYKIGTDNKETKVMQLPVAPRKIWSGKKVVYAVCRKGKTDNLYTIFPEQKKNILLFSTQSSILGVDELGSLIAVMTDNSLVMIDVKDKGFMTIPVNVEGIGQLLSLAVDKATGGIYLSASNGIYRLYDEHLQKISNDIGVLCYDKDRMLVFNNKEPYVIRLRNSFLYPKPQGVVIEIK